MTSHKIDNLKDFIKAYGNKKTDQEISEMLDIPLEQVKNQKEKSLINIDKKPPSS